MQDIKAIKNPVFDENVRLFKKKFLLISFKK